MFPPGNDEAFLIFADADMWESLFALCYDNARENKGEVCLSDG